jgi:hypothetical protein
MKPLLLYFLFLFALGVGLILDQPIQRSLEFSVCPVDCGVDLFDELPAIFTLLTGNV